MSFKHLKVMTMVGTRPEIIRLSMVIPALDASTDYLLVHIGQNYDYELNEDFFRDLGLRKPDHFLVNSKLSSRKTFDSIVYSTPNVSEKFVKIILGTLDVTQ
jgi:UDP-N-acetylglucosamine 2-epimerase